MNKNTFYKEEERFNKVLNKLLILTNEKEYLHLNGRNAHKKLYNKLKNKIQLYPEAYYNQEENLSKFLLFENPYHRLYLYLQNDETFLSVQTQMLKLHMGLFAYADAWDRNLCYLYGPYDLPEDEKPEKAKPHFYLKAFYCKKTSTTPDCYIFVPEPTWSFEAQSREFYYLRSRTSFDELDFVRILHAQKGTSHYERRTKFERELEIIYAPSGEMDACILCYIFLLSHKDDYEKLKKIFDEKNFNILFQKLITYKFELGRENKEDSDYYKLDEKFKKYFAKDPIKIRYFRQDKRGNLFEWLWELGLIEIDKKNKGEVKKDNLSVTERGSRMIQWVAFYLSSLKGEKLNIFGYTDRAVDSYFSYKIIRSVKKFDADELEEKDYKQNRSKKFDKRLADFLKVLIESEIKENKTPAKKVWKWICENKPELCKEIKRSLHENKLAKVETLESEFKKKIINSLNKMLESEGFYIPSYWKKSGLNNKFLKKLSNLRELYSKNLLLFNRSFQNIFNDDEFNLLKELRCPSWLDGIDLNIIEDFIKEAKESRKRKKYEIELLLKAVRILLLWGENENDTKYEEFKKRCRFNLLGHLQLRAGRHGFYERETSSRAWLVFPISYEDAPDVNRGLRSVGFFLGTFKDSTDAGEGYFENSENQDILAELIRRITLTKQLIKILSEVESREKYLKEIFSNQLQTALELQHKYTIHEIKNLLMPFEGIANRLNDESYRNDVYNVILAAKKLKSAWDELNDTLQWMLHLSKNLKYKGDLQFVSKKDLKIAYEDEFLRKLESDDDLISFIDNQYESNHEDFLKSIKTDIKIPFFTYKKLLGELASNLIRYADRNKKCEVSFKFQNSSIIIEIINTYTDENPEVKKKKAISTGVGLMLFEKFLKLYNEKSEIDRRGMKKEKGAVCKCIVKLAINSKGV